MERSRLALVLSGLCTLCGCNSPQQVAEIRKTLDAQEKEFAAIRQEMQSLRLEVSELKGKQGNLDFSNLVRDLEKIAILTPGDTGYSLIRFDLGVLAVQMADVKAYANGTKISLKFGNPLSSSINGLEVKLDWGKVNEKGMPADNSEKSKQFTFSEIIRSGAWTTVPVVLEGIPPADLGYVRVYEIAHGGMSLSK